MSDNDTLETVNGRVPTKEEALELLEAAGVNTNDKMFRIDPPHKDPIIPHNYDHINFPLPGDGKRKGTIKIQPYQKR